MLAFCCVIALALPDLDARQAGTEAPRMDEWWKSVEALVAPVPATPSADPTIQKRIERFTAAAADWRIQNEAFRAGRASADEYAAAGQRLLLGRLGLPNPEVVQVRDQYWALTLWNAQTAMQLAKDKDRLLRESDAQLFQFLRFDAELQAIRSGSLKQFSLKLSEPPNVAATKGDTHQFQLPELAKLKELNIEPANTREVSIQIHRANHAILSFRGRSEEFFLEGRNCDWQGSFERLVSALKDIPTVSPLQRALLARDCQQFALTHFLTKPNWPDLLPEFRVGLVFSLLKSEKDLRVLLRDPSYRGILVAKIPVCTEADDLVRRNIYPSLVKSGVPTFCSSDFYKTEPAGDDEQQLLRLIANCAIHEVAVRYSDFNICRGTLEGLFAACRRAKAARLDLCESDAQKVQTLKEYDDCVRAIEARCELLSSSGNLAKHLLERSRYERLDSEIELLELTRRP